MARKDRFLVALGVECTLSDIWICMWTNIHNLRSCTGEYTSKTEAIAYTRRKRPAKQPCFDSEGEPHSAVERGGGGGGGGAGG